jgi:uncharacterized membrane protein
MSSSTEFLSEEQKQRITAAIEEAEKMTSGEIRVHIENWCWFDAYQHAQKVFKQLKMHETRDNTGVLIYVAVKSHKAAVIGDAGINAKVPADFWKQVLEELIASFKSGKHAEGIIGAVQASGRELTKHFPLKDDDKNELTNSISFG